MDRYLVIGNPIAHSLSPIIHRAFAEQTKEVLTYERLCVEPENFFKELDDFFRAGGKGANITAPFKGMAYQYTQGRCSKNAQITQAVNTLYLNPEDGQIWGETTDGVGLLRDLRNHQQSVTSKKILILGAGGTTRSILPALFSENPESITVYNRTQEKIEALMGLFSSLGSLKNLTSNQPLSTLHGYDLVFNTIPSLASTESFFSTLGLDKLLLRGHKTYFHDVNYQKETPFLEYIQSIGATHMSDGLGMLIEQAAESFFIWRGVRPSTSHLSTHLRQSSSNANNI